MPISHFEIVGYFSAHNRDKAQVNYILPIRATGCSHVFYDKIKLTGFRKLYILITVIKINSPEIKMIFIFIKL